MILICVYYHMLDFCYTICIVILCILSIFVSQCIVHSFQWICGKSGRLRQQHQNPAAPTCNTRPEKNWMHTIVLQFCDIKLLVTFAKLIVIAIQLIRCRFRSEELVCLGPSVKNIDASDSTCATKTVGRKDLKARQDRRTEESKNMFPTGCSGCSAVSRELENQQESGFRGSIPKFSKKFLVRFQVP